MGNGQVKIQAYPRASRQYHPVITLLYVPVGEGEQEALLHGVFRFVESAHKLIERLCHMIRQLRPFLKVKAAQLRVQSSLSPNVNDAPHTCSLRFFTYRAVTESQTWQASSTIKEQAKHR